jgi:hypothetical protein
VQNVSNFSYEQFDANAHMTRAKFLVTHISNEKPMCSFALNVFNMHINLFHMHNICVAHNAYQPSMLKTLHATMLVTNVSYIMVRTSSFFY